MQFIAKEKQVRLKMWEKTEMPKSIMVENNGKKSFQKTGEMIEMTTYYFTDIFGEKLVLTSADNTFRTLEGKEVTVTLDIEFNSFKNVNKIKLVGIEEVKGGKA